MCEHRFCSQTKTRGDRNCTACFSLANIFNQSTNKSFGVKLQSEVTGGFTQGQRDYPALRLDAKTAKTNADKAQLFAESVERHFGIQSNNFDSKHFDEVNQFIEVIMNIFILLKTPMITDRTWTMIMILWLMLTLILSLR